MFPFYILSFFLFLSHFSKSSHFRPILPCILLLASLFIKGWWDGGPARLYVLLMLLFSLEDRKKNERTVEHLPWFSKKLVWVSVCVPLSVHSKCVCRFVRLWPHQLLLLANRSAPAFLADTIPLSYWSLSNPPLTDALSHWTRPEFCTLKAALNSVCVWVLASLWHCNGTMEDAAADAVSLEGLEKGKGNEERGIHHLILYFWIKL